MHVVEIGLRPTHELRFQRRAHLGDAGQDGFRLLQPGHRFGEQLLRDRVAALRERGRIADRLKPIGGERRERAVEQILAQAIAVLQAIASRRLRFDGRVQQRRLRLHRQLLASLLDLLRHCDPQQPAHAFRVMTQRFVAIGMHRQRHAVAVVVQRGIRRHAAGTGDGSGNRLHREIGQPALRQPFGGTRRERISRAFAEARAQVVEVARFGQHVASFRIEQAQIRAQVRIDAGNVEIDRAHFGAGQFLEESRQRALETIGVRLWECFGECAREIRRRHEIAAQDLRQGFDRRRGLVGDESGRQPRQPRRVQRIEQMQRHRHGHAVVRRAGLEAIAHRQAHVAQRQIFREALRIAGAADHQIVERPFQLRLFRGRQFAVPRIQRLLVVDLRRQAVEIPLRLPVLVDDQSRAPLLGFLFLRFRQGREIARQERGAGVDLAGHQRIAGEDLPGFLGKQRAIVHGLLRRQHQPEQTDLFAADHAPLRSRPVRIVMPAREQMRQFVDRPLRLDRGVGHRPHFFGIEKRRRQQPRRWFL